MPNVFPAFPGPPTQPALSVMSDPRICRGSVVARRREETAQRAAQEKQKRDEHRFRTEIIRNRLKMIIAPSGAQTAANSAHRQILALRSIECPRASGTERSSIAKQPDRKHSMARLAGPLRRQYQPSFGVSQKDQGCKVPGAFQLIMAPQEQAGLPQVAMTNAALFKNESSKPLLDQSDEFKNVRFLPFHEQNAQQQGGMAKVVPTLPEGRIAPGAAALESVSSFKTSASRKSSQRPSEIMTPMPFRRRMITWSDIQTPEDPPPSATGPPTFTESGMQTEEDKAFDDTFAPLISSLVSGAISDAMRSLYEEEELKRIAERENKLMETIMRQNAKNSELNQVVEQQIELQKELMEQKAAALRQLRALEARRLAIEALEGLDVKSVEELLSRNMIQAESGQCSVAADTRHLERSIARTKRATAEVRADFFPYVYARAERIFVERLAGSYLKDALFARDENRRDEAQSLLNAQIFKYNQLIDASKKRQAEAAI